MSKFATDDGWSKDSKLKKLWDRVPAHEKSQDHNDCYITWKTRKATVLNETSIDLRVNEQLSTEINKWKNLLKRIMVKEFFKFSLQ